MSDLPRYTKTIMTTMQTALNLSGGGAKGAFQAGAITELAERGVTFDMVHGVSAGALNGAMVATGQIGSLESVWRGVTEDKVHKKRSLARLAGQYGLFGIGISDPPRALYDNSPLREMIEGRLLGKDVIMPFYVGTVDLVSGTYTNRKITGTIGQGDIDRIIASTAIPIIYDPVEFDDTLNVDGGVRNVSPISMLLPHEPDQVIAILTSPLDKPPVEERPDSLHEIARRTLDLLLEDVYQSDIQRFVQINALVRQAEKGGVTLTTPSGRAYRYYPYHIIQPSSNLGDTLNFSDNIMRAHILKGKIQAQLEMQQDLFTAGNESDSLQDPPPKVEQKDYHRHP